MKRYCFWSIPVLQPQSFIDISFFSSFYAYLLTKIVFTILPFIPSQLWGVGPTSQIHNILGFQPLTHDKSCLQQMFLQHPNIRSMPQALQITHVRHLRYNIYPFRIPNTLLSLLANRQILHRSFKIKFCSTRILDFDSFCCS